MPSMNIVFSQILVVFLYVVIGYAAGKAGVIDPGQRKYLSGLCSSLIVPFTVLSAADQRLESGQIADIGLLFIMILLLFIATTGVSLLVQRFLGADEADKVTTAALVTYPNCLFLGLPLCRALFGDIAILYSVAFVAAYNVLFFTWQYNMYTGEKFKIRNLITPPNIATVLLLIMLSTGLRFPAPVQTVINGTGSIITPLSLIIIGVMMSENRILTVFGERKAYLITLLRNIVLPFLFLPFIRMTGLDPSAGLCVFVYMACPCASLSTIYAIKYDKAPGLAAHSVLMSTIAFAFTLPLVILAGSRFLG